MSSCNFCEEGKLSIWDKTKYGSVVIYKFGDSENGWFATLSPKTGGDPKKDFSIQLMPIKHLKYFSDINADLELAKNYGIIFARLSFAISEIIKSQEKSIKIPISVYGKCKHEDEHIHIKLFPYRGNLAQPFTVDSSFEKKEIFLDEKTGEEFVKFNPVKKIILPAERFEYLSKRLINILEDLC